MKDTTPFDLNRFSGIGDFFARLWTIDFMPHGHCYFWRPEILWTGVISDLVITLSYYAIPVMLVYFVIRRRNVPFDKMFVMFGLFIFACGTTHLVSVVTVWNGIYRVEVLVKAFTAVVSLVTAVMLLPRIPQAIEMPNVHNTLDRLTQEYENLRRKNEELNRLNRVLMGREKRIQELKSEVNDLYRQAGRPEPYPSVRRAPENGGS